MKSIDFGHQGLNDHANTPDIFDTAKYPTATYTGKLAGFSNGVPKTVEGNRAYYPAIADSCASRRLRCQSYSA